MQLQYMEVVKTPKLMYLSDKIYDLIKDSTNEARTFRLILVHQGFDPDKLEKDLSSEDKDRMTHAVTVMVSAYKTTLKILTVFKEDKE